MGLSPRDIMVCERTAITFAVPEILFWRTLLLAEKTFRRLDAPELLADVASGAVYVNGVRAVNQRDEKVAA